MRRCIAWRVHVLDSLVPKNIVQLPSLLSEGHAAAAASFLEDNPSLIPPTPLATVLKGCVSVEKPWEMRSSFQECIGIYRLELQKPTYTNPLDRIHTHQALMAATFYSHANTISSKVNEPAISVRNHYNFDVRRDRCVTRAVLAAVQNEGPLTEDEKMLVATVLRIERRLFGKLRLAPYSGRRWVTLGCTLDDIRDLDQLTRILDKDPFKSEAHFELKDADVVSDVKQKKRWKHTQLACLPEETAFPIDQAERTKDMYYEFSTLLPDDPLSFRERLREQLLRFWVFLFSMWLMFWMVDEEIITLVSLIVLKWKQSSILKEEAERTGSKVYIARSRPV